MVRTDVANLALMNNATGDAINKHQSQSGGIVEILGCDSEHVRVQILIEQRALFTKCSR